jgi:hypothetical protein
MKLAIVGILILLSVEGLAQMSVWSPTTRVLPDSIEAYHHALVENQFSFAAPDEDLVVFVGSSRTGSNIFVLQSKDHGAEWGTLPQPVTNDTLVNDHPSIARFMTNGTQRKFVRLLVWERGRGEICFSRNPDSVWSAPALLASGEFGGRTPHIAPVDTSFGAVWENGGRILYTQFRNNAWSQPTFITTINDTVNFLPQVRYYNGGPVVIWERRKRASRERCIAYSVLSDTGWSAADTLTAIGDNRSPRFLKLGISSQIVISYESNRNGLYAILTADGYRSGRGITWSSRAQPFHLSSANVNFGQATFGLIPIITIENPNFFYYTAGSWRESVLTGGDSIRLGAGMSSHTESRSAGNGENTNPILSCGVFWGFNWRTWCIWESNVGGKQRLYGSTALFRIDDVKEDLSPTSVGLFQNYPNPFNPSTEIKYQIPKVSHVVFKVFDLLGREVAKLVDEMQDAGIKSVTFNASGLVSGVYLYRLQAGDFVSVKKMIVMK